MRTTFASMKREQALRAALEEVLAEFAFQPDGYQTTVLEYISEETRRLALEALGRK
jgi:hypothetical protein